MRFQYDIFENFKSFYVYTRTLDETKKVANVIDNLAEDYEYSWGEVPEFNEERFDKGGSAFRIWGDDITNQKDAKHIYREIKAMVNTETAETTETAKTAETTETAKTAETTETAETISVNNYIEKLLENNEENQQIIVIYDNNHNIHYIGRAAYAPCNCWFTFKNAHIVGNELRINERSETTKPDTTETTEPDTTEPDTTEPDTTETSEPDTTEPVTSEPFFYSRITEPTEIFRLCDTDGDAITLALPYGQTIVWQNKYLAGVWVEHMDVKEKNIVVCLQMLAKKYGVVTFPETLTTEIGKILVSLPFGNVRRLRSNTGNNMKHYENMRAKCTHAGRK